MVHEKSSPVLRVLLSYLYMDIIGLIATLFLFHELAHFGSWKPSLLSKCFVENAVQELRYHFSFESA